MPLEEKTNGGLNEIPQVFSLAQLPMGKLENYEKEVLEKVQQFY
jgi:hypothetical protein